LTGSKASKLSATPIFLFLLALFPAAVLAQKPNVQQIIQKSVAANQRDFKENPNYTYKELDRSPEGSKLYRVMMIEGTPYNRRIAVNGKPLSAEENTEEEKKLRQTIQQRRSESSEDRQKRIAKYEKERARDNAMMNELTKAFNFTLVGERKVRGFNVWVLKATPRPGYKPPNMECQVLPGMQGELWIDQKTYQWVKVTAQVVHPVSIEGFLAEVEPGTQFELEKSPVGNGIWMTRHFAMHSNAKVLHMFGRASQEDESYFDYQRTGGATETASASARR
jgi:hypothetical protein